MDNFNAKVLINEMHEIENRLSEVETILCAFQELYNMQKADMKQLESRIEALEIDKQ